MIGGVKVSSTSGELAKRHGRNGKAGAIVPTTIDELIHHCRNFKILINIIMGEDCLLSTQYGTAVDTITEYSVDLMSLTEMDGFLPGKILWFLHLRTQTFLKSCSEAIDEAGISSRALEWEEQLRETGQGTGSLVDSLGPRFLREKKAETPRGQDKGSGNMGSAALNKARMRCLQNGVGYRIYDSANSRRVPPPISTKGVPMCLDYHLLGKCERHLHCPLRATHGYLKRLDWEVLQRWIFRERKIADFGDTPVVPAGSPPTKNETGSAKGRG